MSLESPAVSLIELSKQLKFEIDATIKEKLCFAETLVVSCGHYEGDVEDESSESDWSSSEIGTEETETVQEVIEIKDYVAEEVHEEEDVEKDNGFYFYFFPDCNKPISPQNSKCSIVVENGMPKINLAAVQNDNLCTCKVGKKGECPCNFKIPCSCGAKTKPECTCSQLKAICICDPLHPELKCLCHKKDTQVCVCDPDGKIYPTCACSKVDKPCICDCKKYPSPICKCPHKPKAILEMSSIFEKNENYSASVETEGSEQLTSEASFMSEAHEEPPCKCQAPDPKPLCYCTKGKECICDSNPCICGVQRFRCVCEPSDFDKEKGGDGIVPCRDDASKSICSCDVPKVCICGSDDCDLCQCFPVDKPCTCSIHSDECKCFQDCECDLPCLCDTVAAVKPEECICLSPELKRNRDITCTCPRKANNEANKLKRVRAGKHGYRWCHEVDPRHTFFDYSYDKHDKIKSKERSSHSMFKILGLHDEVKPEVECPVHGENPAPPKYTKKVRKPSLDCCSAVGGMSISVETLGEDKAKFLIQVVSYSSKEGAKTGTKLVSIVDCNLHTMEENRSEHITRKDKTKERRSYMAIIENGYYNKVSRTSGDKDVVKRLYHTFEKAHDFLLEGANIILLRYLALQRHKGQIRTDTVMIDGKICESILVCLGVCQAVVNGVPMFVVKIERHIIEPSGRIHQTLTTLTLRGYVVSHEWADNNYILHLNPLLRINPQKDEIEPHAPLREKWREDLQLMSDYLDFKSTRTTEGGRYIAENGVLSTTIRDYLQAILLLRPQDTLHFTKHYFASVLSALDIPHDEYFNPCSKHVRYYFFED